MFTTYILYSEQLQKFYTGFTSDKMTERLRRHNTNHRGFTGKANDWVVVYRKVSEEKKAAMVLEKKIKNRGAKRFLDDQKS